MTPEIIALMAAAASIALVHTLLGPDHYLPFVALARGRGWSLRRALAVTLFCGSGHIVGSVLLGFLGLYLGIRLGTLEWIEGLRGDLAGWALVAFGLVYFSWGLRRAQRSREHSHWHSHGAVRHRHPHGHHAEHSHPHTGPDAAEDGVQQRGLVAWALFIVFVLGPCEPLIPLLMFPAARESAAGVMAVTGVFALVTIATMLGAVAVALWGAQRLQFPGLARFGQAIAGGVVLCCGLAITVLGL
ncbi:hypothetical protein [Pseudohaliea sp.]|uniref:hypothetical protein n=1 Tax=Pseudohaliea sp. TaxID=2740289 RepID=UPI0032EEFBCA